MRSVLALIAITCFSACGSNAPQKENKADPISVKIPPAPSSKNKSEQPSNWVPDDIIAMINEYYQKGLGKGCKAEKENSDSMISITYHTISDNKDDDEELAGTVYIPKMNIQLFGANSVLKGDLNDDKADDLIISVQVEGEGGGNSYYQDLFVFITDNGKYKLTCITLDAEITGCDSGPFGGSFRATGIENGFLIGNTDCYAEDDGHCCPSLHYISKVKFSNKKLEFVSKEITQKEQ